jgi:hypothetical protein
VGPCKSFATTTASKAAAPRCCLLVEFPGMSQTTSLSTTVAGFPTPPLLPQPFFFFFLNPSSSSSHNLELASNNYPKLCKQIKKQQQQRVQEANCRSQG